MTSRKRYTYRPPTIVSYTLAMAASSYAKLGFTWLSELAESVAKETAEAAHGSFTVDLVLYETNDFTYELGAELVSLVPEKAQSVDEQKVVDSWFNLYIGEDLNRGTPFLSKDRPTGKSILSVSTWPSGATAIFAPGSTGKTVLSTHIAQVTKGIYIPFGEPDVMSTVDSYTFARSLSSALGLALRGAKKKGEKLSPIVIDSLRLPYRLAEGGGAKAGGLAPGFDRVLTALSILGLRLNVTIVAVVNPGDPNVGAASEQAAAMASVVAESAMGVIQLIKATVETGFTAYWGFRPHDRFSATRQLARSFLNREESEAFEQVIHFELEQING